MQVDQQARCILEPASQSDNATVFRWVDTIGFDRLELDIVTKLSSATGQAILLSLRESDVVPTNTNTSNFTAEMSAIAAFTGGTATSSTVGFVLPTEQSSYVNRSCFKMTLVGRKRFIGVSYTPGSTATFRHGEVRLGRPRVGPAEALAAATADGTRVIVNG